MEDIKLLLLLSLLIGILLGVIIGEKACESRMRTAFKKKEAVKLRGKKFRILDEKRCNRLEKSYEEEYLKREA